MVGLLEEEDKIPESEISLERDVEGRMVHAIGCLSLSLLRPPNDV
jgi:hypothetical protein